MRRAALGHLAGDLVLGLQPAQVIPDPLPASEYDRRDGEMDPIDEAGPDELPHHDICIPCLLMAARAHSPLVEAK